MRPIRVVRITTVASRPGSGCAKMSSIGMKLIKTNAIAASEPSSPARGTDDRIQPQIGAQASFSKPLSTKHQMPMCQVRSAASASLSPNTSRPAKKDGPSTKKIMPNSDGVSIPSGIAVTSSRPVFRASRNASQKKAMSPTSTPSAVPGTMVLMMKSVGNWNAPPSNITSNSRLARLSKIRPKNAFTSPDRAQR